MADFRSSTVVRAAARLPGKLGGECVVVYAVEDYSCLS